MQRQWEICWTAPVFDTFIFHHIVLIWILLKSSGRRWSLSFVNSRHGPWMLFRTRYNVLFRQFRLLTAQAGSIPAAICLCILMLFLTKTVRLFRLWEWITLSIFSYGYHNNSTTQTGFKAKSCRQYDVGMINQQGSGCSGAMSASRPTIGPMPYRSILSM